METVAILSQSKRLIETLVGMCPNVETQDREILFVPSVEDLQGRGELALLVLFPDAEIPKERPLPACRCLLLPSTEAVRMQGCTAACVMSYGTSSKDSLTVSSIEARCVSLAVQRELVTMLGGTVDRQELVIPLKNSKDPLPLLACVGLLLVMGVPAEELPALVEEKLGDVLR